MSEEYDITDDLIITMDEDGQKEFSLIPHSVEKEVINQRAYDGYINATALCKACNKEIKHYLENKATKEFLLELERSVGIPTDLLIQKINTGVNELRGTWVHPQIAINLAQWGSPKFAVLVSEWVFEWISGTNKNNYRLPYHIRRYLINNDKIPVHTHFSMLNEMTVLLLAPLEQLGYELPMRLMPDISLGKLFSKWCRSKGHNTDKFDTYEHIFDDGKRSPVRAKLYPNILLSDFRNYFHNDWLKNKSIKYFSTRDVIAVEYIKKMLALPKWEEKKTLI